MNVEERVVSSVFGYDVVRDICYRSITSSINELSKCVVTGSGVKLGGRVITKRDLDILEFLNNFKLSTYEQLDRYMKIKNNERKNLDGYVYGLAKTYSVANVINYKYSNKEEGTKNLKVISITGPGLHLVKNYTNGDVDEDLTTYTRVVGATTKRLSYDLRFALKIKPVIDLFLDIEEFYSENVELYNYRMKLDDITQSISYISSDMIVTHRNESGINNIVVRGICDIDRDRIDFLVAMAKSFNVIIQNQNCLNFYLPITNNKPRLLFIGESQKVIDELKLALIEGEVDQSYIDIVNTVNMREYLDLHMIRDSVDDMEVAENV